MKIKRLGNRVKVAEDSSPIGKSPRRKGRLGKGTQPTGSGSGKVLIIQMLKEKGLETGKSLPNTRRQATAGNSSDLRALQPVRRKTSIEPGTKAERG